MAVIQWRPSTVKPVAAVAPNLTAVTPARLVPVMVTRGAPGRRAGVGLTLVTVGGRDVGEWVVRAGGAGTPRPVTVTSTVPAEPAGAVAVMVGPAIDGEGGCGCGPNFTALAPVKLMPLRVTQVPPAVGPVVGLMLG